MYQNINFTFDSSIESIRHEVSIIIIYTLIIIIIPHRFGIILLHQLLSNVKCKREAATSFIILCLNCIR